jgi:hypothetical protein
VKHADPDVRVMLLAARLLPLRSVTVRRQVRIPKIHKNPEPPPWGEYWEPIRRNRAHSRRLMKLGANKRRALITVVHNEPVFLPIWLSYYSRFFAPDDLYVIDNETTDGSTDIGGFVRIPGKYDPVASGNVKAVEKLQHELLEGEYDVVLVTDVDEIVTPTPEWGTLGEYMDEFTESFVTCIGYELLHMIDREEPYDPSRPILDQRGYWFANGAYNKSALATEPMSWVPGFHHRTDERVNYDPDLRLIHLHRMDYEICRARHLSRMDGTSTELDREDGPSVSNWPGEEGDFGRWFYGQRWFYEDSEFEDDDVQIAVERIPESFRGLF